MVDVLEVPLPSLLQLLQLLLLGQQVALQLLVELEGEGVVGLDGLPVPIAVLPVSFVLRVLLAHADELRVYAIGVQARAQALDSRHFRTGVNFIYLFADLLP